MPSQKRARRPRADWKRLTERSVPRPNPPSTGPLTRREAELLSLLGEGLPPRDAALRMGLSPETVRTHTRNLYRKLGVNDRAAAVAIAWREGLVR